MELQLFAFNQQCTDLSEEIISTFTQNYDSSECSHHSDHPMLLSNGSNNANEYTTNIINLIEDCFARNGYLESQYTIADQVKVMALILQFKSKGSCLKCATLLGCQIAATFSKNKSYSQCCKLKFDEQNNYNNAIYALTLVLESHCMSHPSISNYFINKTQTYRELISSLMNAFKSYYSDGTFNQQFRDKVNMMTLTKLSIAKQLISNKFKSKQWKLLIFRQKVLLELIQVMIDEMERYFSFKQSGSEPVEKAIDLIFTTWKYVFIFITILIHKTHKYMTDKQKEVFVADPDRTRPHRVYYNTDIQTYQNKLMLLFHANFVDENNKRPIMDKYDQFVKLFMYAIITLIKEGYWKKSKIFYGVFRRYQRKLFKIKRNEMKCHWIICKEKRKNCDTFKKCSRCEISRYCGKLCQKLDWNYGGHQNICNKYCIDPHELQQKRYEEYQLKEMVQLFKTFQATKLFDS